jgi:hypothetical protein
VIDAIARRLRRRGLGRRSALRLRRPARPSITEHEIATHVQHGAADVHRAEAEVVARDAHVPERELFERELEQRGAGRSIHDPHVGAPQRQAVDREGPRLVGLRRLGGLRLRLRRAGELAACERVDASAGDALEAHAGCIDRQLAQAQLAMEEPAPVKPRVDALPAEQGRSRVDGRRVKERGRRRIRERLADGDPFDCDAAPEEPEVDVAHGGR